MDCKITDTGALRVTITDDERQELTDAMASGRDYWATMSDLFEPYSTNGGFTPFDAGAADPFVGLTGAPCVAEEMDYDDDGAQRVAGRLWWFPDYQIRDPLQELASTGATVFASAA